MTESNPHCGLSFSFFLLLTVIQIQLSNMDVAMEKKDEENVLKGKVEAAVRRVLGRYDAGEAIHEAMALYVKYHKLGGGPGWTYDFADKTVRKCVRHFVKMFERSMTEVIETGYLQECSDSHFSDYTAFIGYKRLRVCEWIFEGCEPKWAVVAAKWAVDDAAKEVMRVRWFLDRPALELKKKKEAAEKKAAWDATWVENDAVQALLLNGSKDEADESN